MSHAVLSHTADTGIEGAAPSFAGLVEELAAGMFELVARIEPCRRDTEVTLTVQADAVEELVVDVLAELLYLSEVDELVFCTFEATQFEPTAVRLTAGGVDARVVELCGPPIKAVTYHDLTVTESSEGWYGRVYFDV